MLVYTRVCCIRNSYGQFVFNIISMIMGSYILWTGSNPFGIILFFGIVAFCVSCWILRPFWKMTVRHFGGKLQPINTARLSVLHWLTNYCRKMSYRFFVLAQFLVATTAIRYILTMASGEDNLNATQITAIILVNVGIIIMETHLFLFRFSCIMIY